MVQCHMHKSKAIELLGGSIAEAARTMGFSYQAVKKWPDVLSVRVSDHVQGVLSRQPRRKKPPAKIKPDSSVVNES
jgi:transcriptional repressor of cell division inhibition gene dicB